nr:hypothetical protein [Tanacetum cinerariifolium]
MESEGAVDGKGISGLFGSMVRKLRCLERIDRQATLHAVTIEEIRVEISESSPLRPYISSLSLAKKGQERRPRPMIGKLKPSLRKHRIEMRLWRMPMELDFFDSLIGIRMRSER